MSPPWWSIEHSTNQADPVEAVYVVLLLSGHVGGVCVAEADVAVVDWVVVTLPELVEEAAFFRLGTELDVEEKSLLLLEDTLEDGLVFGRSLAPRTPLAVTTAPKVDFM